MLNSCYFGDCRDGLRKFIDAGHQAQTCVTSPPYWGLRDYGVDGQIGLESSIDEFVVALVDVFGLVREALADDGTVWLNLGDSYAAQRGGTSMPAETLAGGDGGFGDKNSHRSRPQQRSPHRDARRMGLKHKDLIGMPWRVAFALQADGWYLRQDIIWHKQNPMPESVKDRCTKAHEYVFLLSKRAKYYYDFDAMQEPVSGTANVRGNGVNPKAVAGWATGKGSHEAADHARSKKDKARVDQGLKDSTKFGRGPGWRNKQNESFSRAVNELVERRNRRSVWTVKTEPYSAAHFATFPTSLIEPCVLAGARSDDVVMDPFMGSGTTAQVAERLGRQWFGCELNPEYKALQVDRLRQQSLSL